MTELSIDKNNAGITYALANYAKTVNGGKTVKLTKKQWAEVMAKGTEFNNKRTADNKIFTGGTNLNGPAHKNFIVTGDKINFTEEELNILLNEMGIEKIKGLSIEKTSTDRAEMSPLLSSPPEIEIPETDLSALADKENIFAQNLTVPQANTIAINQTPTPAEQKQHTSTPSPLPEGPNTPETPTPASTELPAAQMPVSEEPEVTYIDETLTPAAGKKSESQPDAPVQKSVQDTPTRAPLEVEPIEIAEGEEVAMSSTTETKLTEQVNTVVVVGGEEEVSETTGNGQAKIPRAFAKRNNIKIPGDTTYDNTGALTYEVTTKTYDIKSIKKSDKEISELGNTYTQVDVFNKKGEVIARKIDGKYLIGKEFVTEEKFNRYARRKGHTVTLTTKLPKLNFDARKVLADVMPAPDVSPLEAELKPLPIPTNRLPFTIEGDPINVNNPQILSYVKQASEKYGVEEELILAVIKKESGFRNNQTSHKGAMGLMQLMPATARGLGVKNPWDPQENIEGGVRVLKTLLDHYSGDVMLALAGYNYGIGNVNKKLEGKPMSINAIYDSLPRETRNYVKTVYSNYLATRKQA